jgi:hypothetical protein
MEYVVHSASKMQRNGLRSTLSENCKDGKSVLICDSERLARRAR